MNKLSVQKDDIAFYIEYLGAKWVSDNDYFDQIHLLYKQKYHNIQFSLIVSTDNDAFNFLKKYRDDIFGQIPVVFCGLNWFKPDDISGFPLCTGVNEDADIEANIKLMLKLHPNAKDLYVIADLTTTGIIVHNEVHKIMSRYKDQLTVHCVHDFEISEILNKVSKLSENSLVLVTIFQKDKSDKLFEFYEIAELVSKTSKVPVYGLWDFHLGYGILGGMLTSGYAQGDAAGKIALRILKGESPANIPILEKSPNRYMFDYNVMSHFNIREADLPKKSIIVNRPFSFYSEHKIMVYSVLSVFILLVVLISFLIVNVALRKKAEKHILKVNERYKSILRAATGFSIIGTDINGLIKVFNEGAELLLGYNAAEVIDKMYFTNLYEKNEIDVRAKKLGLSPGFNVFTFLAKQNKIETTELMNVRKDGSTFPVQLTITARKDSKNNIIGFLGIAIDITERKRVELELKQYQGKLEQLVETRTFELKKTYDNLKEMQKQLLRSEKMATIGQLAAGVAHEINNPTGFVMSNFNTLTRYIEDIKVVLEKYAEFENFIKESNNENYIKFFDEINEIKNENDFTFIFSDLSNLIEESLDGMNRIKRIVSDLKSFSHSENKEREEANIHELIQLALNISWNEIKYKAEVIKDYSDIPKIMCYKQELTQVFLNLFVNATYAILEKGTITIKTLMEDNMAVIEIIDNGSGMSEDTCKHIFEPFFTTKPVGKGTGLGLSIAYNIIQKHDGVISVSSHLGEGTTFTIKLPLQ